MIDINEVLLIHDLLIEKFGGAKGVRDFGALESAIHRPFATFDNNELYPHPIEKAAAIFESVLINHPFIDGNKRIAYVLLRIILIDIGFDLSANQDEKYNFVISASMGKYTLDDMKNWINLHLQRR